MLFKLSCTALFYLQMCIEKVVEKEMIVIIHTFPVCLVTDAIIIDAECAFGIFTGITRLQCAD